MKDQKGSKTWTVMIYMAGDNNLSADMAYALDDIRQAAKQTNESVNIFVYYDSVVQDVPTYYFDFTNKDKVFSQIATQVKHPFQTSVQNRKSAENAEKVNDSYEQNSPDIFIMNC